MPRIAKDAQVMALAELLKPLGFKKRAATWHRVTTDTIHVVNLQGSQWGPDYYLNLGTYLRALGDEATPPEYRCHVRERMEQPDRPAQELVAESEKWFAAFGTVTALAEQCKRGSLPLATTGKAKEFLKAI